MADRVKRTRRYDSPLRAEQAAATRAAILDAAERLFLRDGYGPTSVAAVAREAGVATKTVYLGFDTKAGLLRAVWNRRLRGGLEDVPVAEQQWFLEVLEEKDPERQLRLNARNSRGGKLRVAALGDVVRAAAPLDPEIGALWERIGENYRENQRAVVASIAEKGALKAGLDVERAADILWAINHPTVWILLVGERGWSAEDYEQWTFETAREQLLEPRRRSRRGAR